MKNNIQNLLDKYFTGESTLEEEVILKEYFQGENVEKAHLKYQSLFQFLNAEKKQVINRDFEGKIVSRIKSQNKVLKIRSLRGRVLKVAAVFLVLLTAWIVTKNVLPKPELTMEERWAAHEIKDPEKALETTKAALLFASIKMNRGTKKAAGGIVKIQKVSKYFKTKD